MNHISFRSFWRRRILASLALLVVMLGGSLAVAQPASASFSDCPAGNGCVWTVQNGGGSRFTIAYSVYGQGCSPLFSFAGQNESAKSDFGDSAHKTWYMMRLYASTNCSGITMQRIYAGELWNWYPGNAMYRNAYSFQIHYCGTVCTVNNS